MAYVAKDDILIYLEQTVGIGQGLSTNVKLTFFKDFVGQQLDIRNSGSLRISLFNAAGKRLLTFRYPDDSTAFGGEPISTSTNPLIRGEIEFTISQFHSSKLETGTIYAEVVFIDTKNYFPTTKTYEFDQFELGTVASTGIPALQEAVAGDSLVSTFNISSITDQDPTAIGTASVNSGTPSSVTSITFNNLNENNIRLSSLENFLTKRLVDCNGVMTLINTISPTQYAVYKIISFSRINLNGGANNEFADAIRIVLEFEASSSSQIYAALEWKIGSRISYQLEAYSNVADIETSLSQVLLSIDSLETTIGGNTLPSSIDSLESQISSLTNVLSSIDSLENSTPFTERNLIPAATSGNNSSTGITLSRQPSPATFIEINVNGSIVDIRDGNGPDRACYFSADGGLTPKSYTQFSIGDTLYWNGNLAGYDLDSTDRIDITYQLPSTNTSSSINLSIDSIESRLSSQLLAITSIGDIASVPHLITFTERNRIPIATSGNNSSTGITLARQPASATFIEINVNGSIIDVKDGAGTNQTCYFSVDGGLTPKNYSQLSIGDTLYWNGGLAGYDLDTDDRIDMAYQIES